MADLKKIDIQKIKDRLITFKNKIKKVHLIIAAVLIVCGTVGFFIGKRAWRRYTVTKTAHTIITKICESEQATKNKTGEYTNDLFEDFSIVSELNLSQDIDTKRRTTVSSTTKRTRSVVPSARDESPFRSRIKKEFAADSNVGQSGDYYVEIDADNACIIVKYQRFTPEKTIYYAFFEDAQILCRGKHCKEEASNENAELCYVNGMCMRKRLKYETERPCGDNHGIQTRKCSPTCEGGECEEWGECVCNRGYGWDGETCKQLQTEKDCNVQECFNGVYCEYPEPLNKAIENGTCTRKTACLPNTGWQYTDWDCTCDKKYLCAVKDECTMMPRNLDTLELPEGEGKCNNIIHRCVKNQGWKPIAAMCTCNQIGYFWDRRLGEAKCSPCTNKPENAVFTSNAEFTDSCSWTCNPGFDFRNNDCTKPDGQYLCARTNLQSCTDEFSKIRKMQVDTKPNEGQPCYTDMKDNILFFDKKSQICTICQCVVNVDKKANK